MQLTTSSGRITKLTRIKPEDVEAYLDRRITSAELAGRTGMNASYLRRAIQREPVIPKEPPRRAKQSLIAARKAYRATLAHLEVAEIAKLAYVSLRTARRIKAKAAKLAPEAQPHETS